MCALSILVQDPTDSFATFLQFSTMFAMVINMTLQTNHLKQPGYSERKGPIGAHTDVYELRLYQKMKQLGSFGAPQLK